MNINEKFKWLRVAIWSVLFLLSPMLLSIKAPSQTVYSTLEDTQWQVTSMDYYNTFPVDVTNVICTFSKTGKTETIVEFVVTPIRLGSGGLSGEYNLPVPGKESVSGSFNLNNNFVTIKFSDHIINATIEGNTMKGEVIRRPSNQKFKWSAEKISKDKINSESGLLKRPARESELTKENKFSIPADSPIIGTWKFVEYTKVPQFSTLVKIPPSVRQTITLTFSQNSILEMRVQTSSSTRMKKTNWKYISKGNSSGILEQYQDDELLCKGDVRWIDNNQIEYTTTFHKDSTLVGQKYTYSRQ